MATPVFVWPANPGLPGDCYCPPYENVELTRFSSCVVTCNTTYSIESVNELICFSNFTSPMNKAQVYFVTLTDQCNFPDCFIRKIVASYTITLSKCLSANWYINLLLCCIVDVFKSVHSNCIFYSLYELVQLPPLTFKKNYMSNTIF